VELSKKIAVRRKNTKGRFQVPKINTYRLLGYVSVITGAMLWGTIGIAAQHLYAKGMSPLEAVFLRAFLSFLIVGLILGLFKPKYLKIAVKDIPFFAAYGLISVALFYLFYFKTIDLTGITTAVILLYTAPAFVVVISRYTFGEPLTQLKILCLAATFLGSFLVVRGYDLTILRLNLTGILTGLGAGLTYGLYSIFGKNALNRYHSWTILFYTFGFGSLFLFMLGRPWQVFTATYEPLTWKVIFYITIFPTLLAYAFYTSGLRRLPPGSASIAATIEPVTATLLASLLLHETLLAPQAFGVAMVVGGVIASQLDRHKRIKKNLSHKDKLGKKE